MAKDTKIGKNRTGMQMSPRDSAELLQGSARSVPTSEGDERALAELRAEYIRENEVLGTVPPPGTVKGMATAGAQMLTGNRAQTLIDKLGERLAFERGGTRLYDALILKVESGADTHGIVPLPMLQQIRADEAQHADLVRQAIERLGGDPTAQTPCADLVGVQSLGLMQAINEPRTTVAQGINTILIAELADNAGWELLITLAEGMGQTDLAAEFEAALSHEREHLLTVRDWLEQLTVADAKLVGAVAANEA